MAGEKKPGLYNEDRILKGGYVSGQEIDRRGNPHPKGMKPGGNRNSIEGQSGAGSQVPGHREDVIGVGLKDDWDGVDNRGGSEEEIKNDNKSGLIGLRNASC